MPGRPAASTAAAAEAPGATYTKVPSTTTAMLAGPPSVRNRNIETLCREQIERRFESAGGNHRRQQVGVGCGEGDAAVAIGAKGAGKPFRLIINRQPIGWHDPQCRPSADDLQI